jgi:pyruvate-formate lyase-activating enzyme
MMPQLHFNALVIESTERCNARCAMCYQAAGPKGSDIRGGSQLDLSAIESIIDQAITLPNLDKRVHLSGGETFLDFPKAVNIFRHAKRAGFERIGTTTNAFWATKRETAYEKTRQLAAAGLNYFEVSIDYWHLPYVKVERVRNLLWAARRLGITVILRMLSTKSHHIDEMLRYFQPFELMHVVIGSGRVHPVGRGATAEIAADVYPGSIEGCCERVLNLTISPKGDVFPCCAGADMTTSLACGNAQKNTLAEAVFRMETDRMVGELVHRGPAVFIPIVKELGYGNHVDKDYTGICHLCWDIFRNEDLSAALRAHFEDVHFRELCKFVTTDEPHAEHAEPARG